MFVSVLPTHKGTPKHSKSYPKGSHFNCSIGTKGEDISLVWQEGSQENLLEKRALEIGLEE